jgi:hypothetical protein
MMHVRYHRAVVLMAFVSVGSAALPLRAADAVQKVHDTQAREYLGNIIYSRDAVEKWVNGEARYNEAYHGVLGWVNGPRNIRHGIDGSDAIYRFDADGARRLIRYRDRPCRINTYGDSFTLCAQVNDAETWQEMLAAHLREPVRSFGIGGYSVYQSYRRMLLEESKTPAKYIIFNIFKDDHYRNLTGWRNIRLGYTMEARPGVSSPTLPYIEANPSTGEFVEVENPCPTPQSVYNLSDADWVFEMFKDNFVLKLMLARHNIRAGTPEKSYATIRALAKEQGLEVKIEEAESLQEAAYQVFTRAGLFASKRIVDQVEAYAAKTDRKVLYVLSYAVDILKDTLQKGRRFDQSFVDYLDEKGLPYVDTLAAHLADFAKYKIDVDEYGKQYWIGHYSPRGNFFQAYAIKDRLVEMLDPKPSPYSPTGAATLETPWEGGKLSPRFK